ncbi:MAG: hypothetical protein RL023_77 [Candidatus Parcubacteria bacterium]|jgi:hypothetical protein
MKSILRFNRNEWIDKKVFEEDEEVFELLHYKSVYISTPYPQHFL